MFPWSEDEKTTEDREREELWRRHKRQRRAEEATAQSEHDSLMMYLLAELQRAELEAKREDFLRAHTMTNKFLALTVSLHVGAPPHSSTFHMASTSREDGFNLLQSWQCVACEKCEPQSMARTMVTTKQVNQRNNRQTIFVTRDLSRITRNMNTRKHAFSTQHVNNRQQSLTM